MVQPQLLVVGAINADLVERVARLPRPGETVLALGSDRMAGGKAANQAAAAARALAGTGRVLLVGAVGDDPDGAEQVRLLELSGVDTSLVRRVVGTATGSAVVLVDERGENSIVVNAGANAFVSASNLYGAPAVDVVVAQTEVGVEVIAAAAEHARAHGARLIVNNAPVSPLSSAVLTTCDPLVVNEGEAREMAPDEHSRAVPGENLAGRLLNALGCRSVVVTLGRAGCVWSTADRSGAVPGRTITDVVDTTGAGDAFVGALAAELALGRYLAQAAETATDVAAQSVRRRGTRFPAAVGASGLPVPD